jgi:hypothetical protein
MSRFADVLHDYLASVKQEHAGRVLCRWCLGPCDRTDEPPDEPVRDCGSVDCMEAALRYDITLEEKKSA